MATSSTAAKTETQAAPSIAEVMAKPPKNEKLTFTQRTIEQFNLQVLRRKITLDEMEQLQAHLEKLKTFLK